ncbi:MAG: ligase-associated DNA damage response DEXH box helicase [Gammaproteobacteria bacterium]|nr:ligase-associated DNA damage response DEXH box helicase [Gammaproteobacteria bacterium]
MESTTLQWFEKNNWQAFDFQRRAWRAWHNGESGLIHSSTGSGKTYAAWLGALQHEAKQNELSSGLKVLWITPLRALAADTQENLARAANALIPRLRVECRTGDTSSGIRTKQLTDPPYCLITTPESLSVMLASQGHERLLSNLHTVVVDEWHELMFTKRGVQLELCLARLKSLTDTLRIWGLSATLSNLTESMQALLGCNAEGTLIEGSVERSLEVDSLIPSNLKSFPWSGHLGLQLLDSVVNIIEQATTTLVFTNTRSQTEIWFKALLEKKPEWVTTLAIHHGSIDRALREDAENRLRSGELRCVVCTSSLDLGIDFSPVDQVVQIGSPKGIARLLQRAGRSGHQPGATSRILCVPTHAFELVEIAAVREALSKHRIEAKPPLTKALDVLCQHLVTIALGSGFHEANMHAEIKTTHSFASLTQQEWRWVMDFLTRGGQALQGYPQYHKVVSVAGVYRVMNKEIAQRHRLNIGTIVSDAQIQIAYRGGKRIGTTEEQFVSRLKPGQSFHFAGLHLQLISFKEATAYVKKATRRGQAVPKWGGNHMPLSTELADSVLDTLKEFKQGHRRHPEIKAIESLLLLQQQWSVLPGPEDFLVEQIDTREGFSLFFFPFAGRLAHEGLAMLVAHRLAARSAITVTLQANDYGFELASLDPMDVNETLLREVLSPDNLLNELLETTNGSELAKRRFRNIARIAGLVFEGYPGRNKSTRQLQSSSGLIYDVLVNHDQNNQLLDQARREVLEAQLDYQRINTALNTIKVKQWILAKPQRLTPLSFPLWAESLQSQVVSSQSFQTRVNRMLADLESAAATALGDSDTR